MRAVRVKFDDLYHSFLLASFEDVGEQEAYLCIATEKIYTHSDVVGDDEELPDDIEDEQKYIRLPNKRDLDLGKPLVMRFVRQFLPNDIDEVPACSRAGTPSIGGMISRTRPRSRRSGNGARTIP